MTEPFDINKETFLKLFHEPVSVIKDVHLSMHTISLSPDLFTILATMKPKEP